MATQPTLKANGLNTLPEITRTIASAVLPPPVKDMAGNIAKSVSSFVTDIFSDPKKLTKTALEVAVVDGILQAKKELAKKAEEKPAVELARTKQLEAERKLAEETQALRDARSMILAGIRDSNSPEARQKLLEVEARLRQRIPTT